MNTGSSLGVAEVFTMSDWNVQMGMPHEETSRHEKVVLVHALSPASWMVSFSAL